MSLELKGNRNYAAQIVRIPKLVKLEGLDNLLGVPVLGGQALVSKDSWSAGDLAIAFGPETQLSDDYCYHNNLYRHSDRNEDQSETGYIEDNRRVRAIKLRGHASNVLLMPISSVAWASDSPYAYEQEGVSFDHIDGWEVCRKYVVERRQGTPRSVSKVERAFRRVDDKVFPKHLETDQLARNAHTLPVGREIVVTQKIHGTSLRVGNVPVLRRKGWFERQLNRWFPTADYEYAMVYGSKNTVKDANNPRQAHFYDEDIWTIYGKQLDGLLPEGYIVYAELVGFTPSGGAIQPKYTYEAKPGEADLYVYRVAFVNEQGVLADLPWDGVKEFCASRGLKWVPELYRTQRVSDDDSLTNDGLSGLLEEIDGLMNIRYADSRTDPDSDEFGPAGVPGIAHKHYDWNLAWNEPPVKLSDSKTVDEGVCLRVDGVVPLILKAKCSEFLQHETKQLDAEVVTVEDEA
jgi:hypothetical protein